MELSGTRLDNDLGIQSRQMSELLDQEATENGLADRDEDGTTQLLRKEGDGDARGDIFLREGRLYGQADGLHSQTNTKADKELVGNPVRGVRSGRECGHEALADSRDTGAEDHAWQVVSDSLRNGTGYDGCDDETQDEGKGINARLHWIDAVGGLDWTRRQRQIKYQVEAG